MFLSIKHHRICFYYTAICVIFAFLLVFISRNINGFGQWYAITVYPLLPDTLGRLISVVPFSVAEFLIYTALLSAAFFTATLMLYWFWRSAHWQKLLSALFRIALCTAATFSLFLVLGCSVNYDREPFASLVGLTLQESDRNDLIRLYDQLIDDATLLAPQVTRDENGCFLINRHAIKQEAIHAMKKLGSTQKSLSGYYPQPKPVTFSHNLSKLNLTGIFTPFTMEANYNTDVTDYVIPYTICHELAHVKGFIKEDEAGFISYLACIGSESSDFRYSGTLNALIYVLNALYGDLSGDEYAVIYARIPDAVQRDFARNRAYWRQFADDKVTKIAENANDYYLKANAQEGGTKSYGKIVDLLLAYYAKAEVDEFAP